MGKGQAGVLEAMKQIEQALPFKLLGIDSDNGSEFINYHLKAFCDQKQIQFTRGRPYKKTTMLISSRKTGLTCVKSSATCATILLWSNKRSMIFTETN